MLALNDNVLNDISGEAINQSFGRSIALQDRDDDGIPDLAISIPEATSSSPEILIY